VEPLFAFANELLAFVDILVKEAKFIETL